MDRLGSKESTALMGLATEGGRALTPLGQRCAALLSASRRHPNTVTSFRMAHACGRQSAGGLASLARCGPPTHPTHPRTHPSPVKLGHYCNGAIFVLHHSVITASLVQVAIRYSYFMDGGRRDLGAAVHSWPPSPVPLYGQAHRLSSGVEGGFHCGSLTQAT
jgi:hypothetical protein